MNTSISLKMAVCKNCERTLGSAKPDEADEVDEAPAEKVRRERWAVPAQG